MAKNIILLSDGTGNSAAKLFKTNVWRIYEALDLTDPKVQVACYDDGVGTSALLPVALIAGALGFGLKRNVLRLYRFLCEHYEPGDRIYAFGFSRGAFTIRMLIGLVLDQGVVRVRPTAPPIVAGGDGVISDVIVLPHVINGSELRRLARWAYRRFRLVFNQTGFLVSAGRAVRDRIFQFRDSLSGLRPYDEVPRLDVPEIEFVGLWDTVDAYGLPIDELTSGVDRWIWPLTLPEQRLSPRVRKACHALSLDDERQTFHPVLWDEEGERQDAGHVDQERISQVWFAGAHANVGGGYPNDALAYVSFEWMASEARKRGVIFAPQLLANTVVKRDAFGRIYDSRRGLAASYRYMPRPIIKLTNAQRHEQGFRAGTWPVPKPTVRIDRPKIHESVFTRIAAAPEAYAPVALPEHYAVVRADGSVVHGPANPFEHPAQSRWRAQQQEVAWDLVWWRRVWYFASVLMLVTFALRPFAAGADRVAEVAQRGGATRIVTFIGSFLPEAASPWIDYYAAAPVELMVFLGALAGMMAVSSRIQGKLSDRMRDIWAQVMIAPGQPIVPATVTASRLAAFRNHPLYEGTFAVLRRHVLPAWFAAGVIACALATLNRVAFESVNVAGGLCEAHAAPALVETATSRTFDANHFCYASGLALERGVRYRVRVSYDGVVDGSVRVASPAGFTSSSEDLALHQRLIFALSSPFRRVWRSSYLVTMARVGETGVDQLPLPREENEITPRNDGELFLFVNDAIAPVAPFRPFVGWDAYYPNNRGRITVAIEKLEEP